VTGRERKNDDARDKRNDVKKKKRKIMKIQSQHQNLNQSRCLRWGSAVQVNAA
jgi:hypothetical protein